MTDEQSQQANAICRRAIFAALRRVYWGDCTPHRGIGFVPRASCGFDDANREYILKAAAELKALGIGWEEYT